LSKGAQSAASAHAANQAASARARTRACDSAAASCEVSSVCTAAAAASAAASAITAELRVCSLQAAYGEALCVRRAVAARVVRQSQACAQRRRRRRESRSERTRAKTKVPTPSATAPKKLRKRAPQSQARAAAPVRRAAPRGARRRIMFALLVPAGFALVVKVVKGNAHAQHAAAERKAKACAQLRGAAAGALPDADVEVWRERAVLATERIKGLETIITVRGARRGRAARRRPLPLVPEQTVWARGRRAPRRRRRLVSRAAAPPGAHTHEQATPRALLGGVASRARAATGCRETGAVKASPGRAC
jgi:hypothetical protein